MFEILKKRIFGRSRESKYSAKSRLHFVLVQDRTGLSGDRLAAFKREMVDVIQKYFVIDEAGFDVSYKRETGLTTLIINSPIVVRRESSFHGRVGTDVARNIKADVEAAAG